MMSRQDIPKSLYQHVAQRLKVLGDPIRLELLTQLMLYGEMNVTDLIESVGQRQATVSKHLMKMSREGLLSRRKDGLNVYYDVKDDLVIHCIYTLLQRQYKSDNQMAHNLGEIVDHENA